MCSGSGGDVEGSAFEVTLFNNLKGVWGVSGEWGGGGGGGG